MYSLQPSIWMHSIHWFQLEAGKNTKQDLAEDFEKFDALLAEHQQEKTGGVARILCMKASLYLNVFEEEPVVVRLDVSALIL